VATINLEILEAAAKDGLLPKKLTPTERLYLHSSVKTANQVYWAIADVNTTGLDSEQLIRAVRLSKNTLFEYTRWLESKKFIRNASEGKKNLYLDNQHA
jgi:hypothetical protein